MIALMVTALIVAACTPDLATVDALPVDVEPASTIIADSITDTASEPPTVEPTPTEVPPAPDPTSTAPRTDSPDLPDVPGFAGSEIAQMVAQVDDGMMRLGNRWPGYDPSEHPILISLRNATGVTQAVVALNFPAPETLGTVTPIPTEGTAVTSVHVVTTPDDPELFTSLPPLAFSIPVGAVDAFVFSGITDHPLLDPASNSFVSTLLHELFHRWQGTAFTQSGVGQDLDGYPLTPDNLELAELEDRALVRALTADADQDREQAARQFAALRMERLNADSRVELDNDQERREGTARWIEHGLAGDDELNSQFNQTNFAEQFVDDPTAAIGARGHYSFQRFYATGAAITHLLERFEVADFQQNIESGAFPAEVLIAHLGVTASDVDALVTEARAALDPDGELPQLAAARATQAQQEPSLFNAPFVPTDEEIACFAERGVDVLDGTEPPRDAIDACLRGQ